MRKLSLKCKTAIFFFLLALTTAVLLLNEISIAWAAEDPQKQQQPPQTTYVIDPAEQQFYEMFGEIKEKVTPREIDKKADAIAKEYAKAKSVPLPTSGRGGSVQYVFGTTTPRILCRPLRVTDIELEPGERITNAPFVGDTVNWAVLPSASGSGSRMTYHVIVKPAMPDIATNLIVHTDRRTYMFDLVSSKQLYTPHVTFSYPDQIETSWESFFQQMAKDPREVLTEREAENYGQRMMSQDVIRSHKKTEEAKEIQALSDVLKGQINYNYKIQAKKRGIEWKPVNVYDDGLKTYIEFPTNLDSMEAPVFMLLNGRTTKEMVNYRKVGNTYVVDRLFKRGVLLAGTGRSAQTVVIVRSSETKTPIKPTAPAAPDTTQKQEKKPFTYADWLREKRGN